MSSRLKALFPLAVSIGVLSFLWTEIALNSQFHWSSTDEIPGAGLAVPTRFQLVVWVAFLAWGLFFTAGGDNSAAAKIAIASVFGSLGFLGTAALAPPLAESPDFWAISLWVGVFALILVLIAAVGDWYYVAGTFVIFGGLFGLWVGSGADNWAPNGGGVGSGIARLTDPATAGTGAFGGVLSTPWYWVWFNGLVSALCGVILGLISVRLAAAFTPKPHPTPSEA